MTASQRNRRVFLASSIAAVTVAGCERDVLQETVAEAPTESLETARVSLRGFQIVAFTVGRRVVMMPTPAVRILGVVLLISGAATFLIVEYLDTELRRRTTREELSASERASIESDQSVAFKTDNGLQEAVVIGPNRYENS